MSKESINIKNIIDFVIKYKDGSNANIERGIREDVFSNRTEENTTLNKLMDAIDIYNKSLRK